jgi:hypothetical protein
MASNESLVEPITFTLSGSNRRFNFDESRQPFIRTHNETLSVVAMRISNEDCSPITIHGCHTASTPLSFAEIVSNDFPVFHVQRIPARLLY